MRFTTGTSQSVNTSSQHAVAWMPSFFSSLPTRKPGAPFSITSAVMPFLPFGAKAMNGVAVKGILYGENHAGRSAAARNLLDRDGVGDMIESRAAFGFGKRDAGQPQLPRLAERFQRKVPRFIELFRKRLYFRFRKFAHGALQQLLLFGQLQIHVDSPSLTCEPPGNREF